MDTQIKLSGGSLHRGAGEDQLVSPIFCMILQRQYQFLIGVVSSQTPAILVAVGFCLAGVSDTARIHEKATQQVVLMCTP